MIIKVKKVEDFSNYDKSVFNSLNRFLNSNTIKVDEIKEQIEDCNNQISETIDLLCGYIKSGNRKFYESFNAPDKAVQLEKLLESPYIESAQFQDDNLVIVTKPLKVWKWNWGQYIISYNMTTTYCSLTKLKLSPIFTSITNNS